MADKLIKDGKYREDIAKAAIQIVTQEREAWEDAVCWVTDKVGFKMRPMIKTFRKNYWGVFDKPRDAATGREKTWIPLPQKLVEDYVKNINMGMKDVGFRASNPNGYALTDITRAVVRDYLYKMHFGETMDETDRQVSIDGTVVWKTWETKTSKKVKMNRRTVDLLNCYIDPTEENIQSAYRFTERAIQLPDQIAGMTGWYDRKNLKGSDDLNKNDGAQNSAASMSTTGKYRDTWETYGKIPKWLVTGDEKAEDAHEEIDGHIVVSGIDANDPRCHFIEENKKTDKLGNVIKPYEELRLAKITGRWYGLGLVERVLALTEWSNINANIRISRNYVSQLGLFKVRKNSGITPQMLAKLPVNGAVTVNDMGDIEQLPMSEPGAGSYKEEEVIKEWAQSITGAYPISAGGDVPASQTATTSAIQNSSAKTGFTLAKEAKGGFFSRWMDRHALPIIAKTFTAGDLIRLSGDDEFFKDIIERVVAGKTREVLSDEFYSKGIVPSEMEVRQALEATEADLLKKQDLFFELVTDLIADHVDTHVYFTNEDLDTAVTVQNIINMLNIAPEYRESMIKQIYDLLGLDQPKLATPPAPQMPQGMPSQGMEGQLPPEIQGITESAMVPQNTGMPQ